MPNTESIKNEITKLVEKYNTVAEEKRIGKYNEEMTKKDFILPLFRTLGWSVENSSEVTAEEKISKGRVDYSFRINGIPKFFLEAKALREDLENPKFVEQAINYAWHKGCTWAVLTDFESVKIFNAEWRTSNPLQSHLKTIPCQEFIPRFDELWLLSKKSFDSGLIDDEAEKWGKKTKKISVDKQLLTDFTRFREILSKNIAKLNRSKNLTEEDLDESVQRILDRLIFIRSCEDRELEAKSLISSLREWESRGKGQFIKYLREVFAYFDKLYNSKIFANHLCDDLDIDNEVLNEIIEGLYYTKDNSVSYDFSAIEADVLGNIYEQYLGHILKKSEKRAKLTKSHTHRKEQGIYYTPTYIVDYIVRNTLGELLKDKKVHPVRKDVNSSTPFKAGHSNGVNAGKIRVLDPACGSGSFLIKAFDVLNEHYARYDKNYSQSQMDFKTGLPFTTKVKILQNNIFGVDLDKQAVEIAQLNLLLKIAEKGQRLPLLQQNIKCGNSLIDDPAIAGDKAFRWEEEFKEILNEGGFDIVIGNPPYVDSEEMVRTQPTLREMCTKIYSTAKGNWDIFCIFIERGLTLLKDGGFFGMIVPNKLLSAEYALEIRRFIQKYKIFAVRDYSKIPVFQASVYPIVIIIQKETPKHSKFSTELMESYGDGVKIRSIRKINQEDLNKTSQNTWAHIFERSSGKIIDKIFKKSTSLINFAEVSGASTVSEAYELKKIITELSNQKEFFKFINTGTIDRYSSLWGCFKTTYIKGSYNKPIILKKSLKRFSNKRYEESTKEKIIVAGMTKRLESCLDCGEYLAGKSTTIVTSNKTNLKIILAILNSSLMAFVYKTLFMSLSLAGGYMRVGPPQVKNLPIKQIPESQQQPLIKLVDKMLSLNKRLNDLGDKKTDERSRIEEEIKKTDAEVDELVYHIYGITEEEKKIIEESLK